MKLWHKILMALLAGMVTGYFLGPNAVWLKPVGQIFLSLISMLIMPLILSSMAVGITSIQDPAKLGRLGIKTLGFFLITTLMAITLGLTFAHYFSPGSSLNFSLSETAPAATPMTLSQMLLSIFPSNPIAAMNQGNVLQVIVFALFLGLAINFAGEKGKPLKTLLESLAEVMYRLASMIMEFSPIGIFAIMAWVTGSFGAAVLWPLLQFLFLYYAACLIHLGVVFLGTVKFKVGLPPLHFLKGMKEAILMAFSTCSSSATLPVAMKCCEENLGVSKSVTGFVLPLGSTINMNGAALFQGMAALFVAQAYGLTLDLSAYLMIMLTATLSAIGAAGIPGTGFIMLTVVFVSVGIPIEGLVILAGVDRVREMMSTVLNVLGDCVCALWLAREENELDLALYPSETVAELT